MKRVFLFAIVLLVSAGLSADSSLFDAAEDLRIGGDRQGAFDLLEQGLKSAGSNQEKAEFYWRMAETYLNMGDDLEDIAGDEERMALYEQGEAYANRAIDADPRNHTAYYMKSANIGRWGQTKGIISSLFKAGDMKENLILAVTQKPNYSDAWNVLAMLYAAVPGRPISFGNVSFAVSLSRKAYASREEEIRNGDEEDLGVGIRKEMALHLWDRNWSASKRVREQSKAKREYDSESDLFEKNRYFEGTIALRDMDDREEAVIVLADLIRFLQNKSDRTMDEENDLEEVLGIMADWTE